MKLLLENWRKFLTEQEYFSWSQTLEDEGVRALETEMFDKIGEGEFRNVYVPKGEDDVVIKAIKTPADAAMNRKEAEANRKFPKLFPKTYAHADDWSWVVMDKLDVLEAGNDSGFDRMVLKNFPNITSLMKNDNFIKDSLPDLEAGGEAIFHYIVQAAMYGGAYKQSDYKTDFSKQATEKYIDSDPFVRKNEKNAFRKVFEFGMKKEPMFVELFKAYNELKLEPSDFVAGNIAVNDSGELFIIDASYIGD